MKDTLIANRYRLQEPLGSGGEARVFRARDETTGTLVALRLGLQPATHTSAAAPPAFHPGWVQLLDSGIDPKLGAYQILELLAGKTLGKTIESAPLDTAPWQLFVRQSLHAVDALHAAGWIHGDLNADNFLNPDSSRPHWKLLELPFLRFDAPAHRSPLFGSIHTLAPEQINGAPADARSDLYSLGCLYYYAAAGVYPQTGTNHQDIVIERLRFAPPPLREKAPQLPPFCCDWVMQLLQRDPRERPDSIAAAHHLLEVASSRLPALLPLP
jgi:serine/threonine protein kinase